jgi:hypothetical protein
MTVKPETTFWKSVKILLDGGDYIVSRLESYVTPGFPDCLVFHKDVGFFTLELKVLGSNNKVILSPFQIAWNMRHALAGAPSYILVSLPVSGTVKLFHGCKTKDLGENNAFSVPGLYEGRLVDLDLCQVLSNSQTP